MPSGDITYTFTVTERDLRTIILTPFERGAVRYLGRPDATIEERLMALQIIARKVELEDA